MNIYTKTGDKGKTSLIGGKRVSKYNERIEAYGTIDELNAYIGLIRDQKLEKNTFNTLIDIQNKLMICGTMLATEQANTKTKNIILKTEDITKLEKEIDKINDFLPSLKKFILPGGHTTVSYCHIARTICRRAERLSLKVIEKHNLDFIIIQYLNRLSDYLFVLSRKFTIDLKATEIEWKY
ncbi:MAG: cob(I)yrinic acid a,c-diamide adenosyltransferase [Bacteroidales bacterium]|jgi:cob(I)alamin adenosyltransferase|nr:cob(I)yrinic acid a,c-diamide adenosyltransferase [Bacteroidales bacterium]